MRMERRKRVITNRSGNDLCNIPAVSAICGVWQVKRGSGEGFAPARTKGLPGSQTERRDGHHRREARSAREARGGRTAQRKGIRPGEVFFAFTRRFDALRRRARRIVAGMTEWSAEEPYQSLVEHRLGRSDLLVKLDRGFEQGVYGICIVYAPLAERVGFTAARRQALDYAVRLHGQLARLEGYAIDDIEDDSRTGGPGRKRD